VSGAGALRNLYNRTTERSNHRTLFSLRFPSP
jgi:hypothetical protein